MIAETTFSSPDNLIILTPCVLRPAILISLTATLITLPLFVDIKISSPSKTGKDDDTFPFLEEFTIPIIPLPPLLVTRNSLEAVLFPKPFSVTDSINLSPFLPFFVSLSIVDRDTIISLSFKFIPLIPFEDLPLNNLIFSTLNLIDFPFNELRIIS